VLIMDEPTAVLAPQEIEGLFATLRAMVAEGKSIIFISHKLQEVMAIADRVTVLRRGRVTAADLPAAQLSPAELARKMVGRDVLFLAERPPQAPGNVVLQVDQIRADNDRGLPALRDISLEVRAGEIVGIAGVAGNGQRELAEVIAGLRRCTGGRVLLSGEAINNGAARDAIDRGLAYVPEDRNHVGSAPNLSLTDNLIMKQYRRPPIGRGLGLDAGAAAAFATKLRDDYQIRAPSVDIQARLLSGGNLQKLILAREIATDPRCIVTMQPTQGLDVGAVETVHRLLLEQRGRGVAILLISEELDELLSLSDRVVVLYEGQIVGEVADGNLERIGLMMMGSAAPPVAAP
jgi:simple sugar transport system ATP-binding protein